MDIDEGGESITYLSLVRQRPQLVYEVPQFALSQVVSYYAPGLNRESMAGAFIGTAALLGLLSVSNQARASPGTGGDLVVKRLRSNVFPRLTDGTSGPATPAPVDLTPYRPVSKRRKGISPEVRDPTAVAQPVRGGFRARVRPTYRRRKRLRRYR